MHTTHQRGNSSAGRLPLSSVVRHGKTSEALAHAHSQGQLIYPVLGGLLLETAHSMIRLAPDRAAWIPNGVAHAVLIDRSFRYHSLYIEPDFFSHDAVFVMSVRPLLRELILDAEHWSSESHEKTLADAKARVLVGELGRAPFMPSGIAIPDNKRIARICREIEHDPANARSLDEWAREVGASTRTLQRYFNASTGMSFQQWRNRVRMAKALELHAGGARILDVALAVGYSTEGAYAQAFKKFYGYPPSRLQMTP